MARLITVIVDGQPVEIEEGTPAIDACTKAGKYVPHFCYHEKLSIPANCRMCTIHIANSQFPDRPYPMGCCTPVKMYKDRDGNEIPMEIVTDNEQVQKARHDIMEYLLINHPLDCPQCDQAGECDLQNYAYTYGPDRSRFHEDKVIRHTKKLGPEVSIWGNRCIACGRCSRFCDEITGTGELSLVNRGDRNVIDIFPGIELDNPMSLNTVEICPVGALLSNDFLYKQRVWFMEPKKTVCPSCEKGCNLFADVFEGEVKRLRPRDNEAVNECWTCDMGRLNYKYPVAKNRLATSRRAGKNAATRDVMAEAGATLAKLATATNNPGGSVAVVASAWSTNEELLLLGELIEKLGVAENRRYVRKHPDGQPWVSKSGFRIEADRNPNREGVAHILGLGDSATSDDLGALADAISSGAVKHLVLVGSIPNHTYSDALSAAVEKLETFVLIDAFESALAEKATHVVASTVWLEKTGTTISRVRKGHDDSIAPEARIQRLTAAAQRPDDVRDETEILQRLIAAVSGETAAAEILSPASLFAHLRDRSEIFDGLTLKQIGDSGVLIEKKAVQA